ncbi:MAG: agmatine deiminase family protein [Phycisphaeraceae bacterium]|nr:agmatine deiminase family protein [Phycisphaeraceae bacterium]
MPDRLPRATRVVAVLAAVGLTAAASGQQQAAQRNQADAPPPLPQPEFIDGRLVFPPATDGPGVPRFLTDAERRYLELHPLVAERDEGDGFGLRGPYVSPSGPIRCPGEYEPTDGILISWKSFTSILSQMGTRITNEGQANLYVYCDTTTVRNSAQSSLTGSGANMSRVQFIIANTDSVWIRDYGPRYIYEGNVRSIIDHTYNRVRPNDNLIPTHFAGYKNHARYLIPLIHGGGNYHLNGIGDAFATRLIRNENPTLTEEQIIGYWSQFQNVNTTLTDAFPTTVDLTQHIDMWMQVTGDRSVVVADWPANSGSEQDVICDNTAALLTNAGWTVARVPGRNVSGAHYTYTNVVMCNDIILLPTYTNTTIVNANYNSTALSTWQSHMPGKQIFQINCQTIVTSAGVMHCIVMHVPRHLGAAGPNGGLAPTAYLRNFRGGESVSPGQAQTIRYLSDDDVGVANVDILLSTDGGASFPTVIAAAVSPTGMRTWTPPDIYTPNARIRVVARDAAGNTGFDQSPENFTINGTPCPADFNLDGYATVSDIFAFLAAWFAGDDAADINGGGIAVDDIFEFLASWFAGC